MQHNPIIAGIMSIIIPGLGQMFEGEIAKGALILFAAIVIANLNILILPLTSMANTVIPPPKTDVNAIWRYWIPRITHDIASLWSVAFWLWVIVDAFTFKK